MTASQSLRLYEITLEFIKDKSIAKEYVQSIEGVIDDKFDNKKELFLAVDDKTKLLTKEDAYMLFATKEDMKEQKSELIKWMFIFWVGQVAVTFGFILLFLKK